MLSAKELSMGMTKLSGSRPLLKVNIAIPKETSTIAATARTLAINNKEIRPTKEDKENRPFTDKANTAKTLNITIEAAQALKMFFA